MTVREATVTDLPQISVGAREFYAESEFLHHLDFDHFVRNWTLLLNNGTGVIFLLCEGNEVQGFLGGTRYPDMNNGRLTATESFWYVRGCARGAGGTLYRAFESWARKSGCMEIQMVHLSDVMPEKLSKFYALVGFKRAEVRFSKELPCR